MEVLAKVLKRELPVRPMPTVYDIMTALRIAKEFNLISALSTAPRT